MTSTKLNGLDQLRLLEAEAVHIMREVVAELERPVLLFSGGKDSVVLLRLAEKAFAPVTLPFPVLHVDTGHNFPEVIAFRDRRIADAGHQLIVASVQESIDAGRVREDDPTASRNQLQTRTLLDALEAGRFDAAFGGGRRDEERARAKERVFSFRDEFGQWEPRAQRAEPWALYNGRIRRGEQIRVFPMSNFTEVDVWNYIALEELALPSIYFAHERDVIDRDGMLLAVSRVVAPRGGETVERLRVRYRTVGDLTVTGAVRSQAGDVASVIAEVEASEISERGETRADDRASEAAMEDRKREGYF
jgi:sulfate adenylyltransferase subunit 2